MSGTPRPTDLNASTLFIEGSISAPRGGSYTLTTSSIFWSDSSPAHSQVTNANLMYTIVTLPAHGSLTRSGVTLTVGGTFSHNDMIAGLVVYHNDGSPSTTDTIQLFAEVVETSGVIKPYTPQFYLWFNTINSTTQWAYYIGMTLVGSTIVPTTDSASWGGQVFLGSGTSVSFPVQTTSASQVVFLYASSQNASTSGTYPSPVTVSAITHPSLTFTRIGGAVSFNHINFDTIHSVRHWVTTNVELFSAIASAVVPSANATVTWPATPDAAFAGYVVYGNLADLTHPWGTDAGAFVTQQTSALPGSLTLNTSVSDQLVRVVLLATQVGDYDGLSGGGHPTYGPKGYTQFMGDGTSGGTIGTYETATYQRTSVAYGHISVSIAGAEETLTDAELIFEPWHVFADFTNVAMRRLFVAAGGTPAWVGPSGSIPFNGVPAVYLTTEGPPLDFAQNNGNGGSFVPTGTIGPAGGPGCTPYYITEAAGPAGDPKWRLNVSDDGGRTWGTLVKPRSIGKLGEYQTRLRWLKMGQARERMVKLECTDPVRRNIVGVYIDTDEGMA